jgi:hypothetical protein
VRIWESSTGKPRKPGLEEDLPCARAALSRDGKLLATIWREEARVWDYSTGRRRSGVLRHPAGLSRAEFSPDGLLLLTVSGDRMVRIWQWAGERLVCPPLQHEADVNGAGFVALTTGIVTASCDNRLRIWEWLTGKPLAPARTFNGGFLAGMHAWGEVTRDGEYAVASSSDEIRVFHLLEPDPSGASGLAGEDLQTFGEIVAGQTIHRGGGVANLSTPELLERWKDIRKMHPGLLEYDPALGGSLEWHRVEAKVLERESHFDGALWHLDRLGGAASADDRRRKARIESFVRDWRFAGFTEPWVDDRVFVPVDGPKLEAIRASAASARLLHSQRPFIDFAERFRPRILNVAGFAVRTISEERERQVKILVGGDDFVRVWLNGDLVLEKLVSGGAVPDTDEASVRLVAGENTLVVGVANGLSEWGLFFRIADEAGGWLRLTEEGRLESIEAPPEPR